MFGVLMLVHGVASFCGWYQACLLTECLPNVYPLPVTPLHTRSWLSSLLCRDQSTAVFAHRDQSMAVKPRWTKKEWRSRLWRGARCLQDKVIKQLTFSQTSTVPCKLGEHDNPLSPAISPCKCSSPRYLNGKLQSDPQTTLEFGLSAIP